MNRNSWKEIDSKEMAGNVCFCSPLHSKFAMCALQEKFPNLQFEVKTGERLRQEGVTSLIRSFHSYEKAIFFTYDLDILGMSLLWVSILLWISRRGAYLIDRQGRVEQIDYHVLFFRCLPSFLLQIVSLPSTLFMIKRNLSHITKSNESRDLKFKKQALAKSIGSMKLAYMRTDHMFGVKAGGSVGHVAGVANGFVSTGSKVFLLSTDYLELIDSNNIPVYIVKPKGKYTFLAEVPTLHHNETLINAARPIFEKEKPDLVYQRYSHNNYAGAVLAEEFRLPFILEYNGSFSWMARNWGRPLRFEKMANEIELVNLRAADLVVVVSKPMKEELTTRGIPDDKVLVNPNGVDPQRYRPDLDGTRVRQCYRLERKIVAGFIGTFGRWHGSEIMAKAAVKVVNELNAPEKFHFLFIGDGLMLPETRRIVQEGSIENRVTFTGLVTQEQGAEYLAACDILVSPHVPNPDGTPFFGSPTKLFEYMAMGRGIVASNLEQIGEVLEHDKTGWLVEPGNADELAEGMLTLMKNRKLREFLGRNARTEVLKRYTWEQHVNRTVAKLREMLEP